MLASKKGHDEVVKLLLENRASVDVKNRKEATPLHYSEIFWDPWGKVFFVWNQKPFMHYFPQKTLQFEYCSESQQRQGVYMCLCMPGGIYIFGGRNSGYPVDQTNGKVETQQL